MKPKRPMYVDWRYCAYIKDGVRCNQKVVRIKDGKGFCENHK